MSRAAYPPGPSFLEQVRTAYRFGRDPLGPLVENARRYGDLVHTWVAGVHVYQVNHPDLIRDLFITDAARHARGRVLSRSRFVLGDGLLTSEDSFHLRQRRLMQPAFHRQRIQAYGQAMVACAERAMGRWRDGQTLDLHEEMMRLTLAIVGRTLFDADVERDAREIGDAVNDFMAMFDIMFLPFSKLLDRLPLPQVRRMRRAVRTLDAIVYRLVAERRAEGRDHGDLLSMLLAAHDTEGDGGGMTDRQVRDECVTLILAGHETTANALSFALHLLSRHPAAAARLEAELAEVLGERPPEPGDYPRLVYAERVFAEALRLYPPAYAVARTVVEPYEIAGYRVARGSLVLASQFVAHRDPRFWPDPLRFDPERFTPEAKAARPRFAYFPFGGGGRQCIGEAFAWMEGVLLLAALAQRWRFMSVEVEPALQAAITLRPKHLPMVVHRRGARPAGPSRDSNEPSLVSRTKDGHEAERAV